MDVEFLDGNTWKDSASVAREPWVGDVQAGVVFNVRRFRLACTYVARTREFESQAEHDRFSSLTLPFRT